MSYEKIEFNYLDLLINGVLWSSRNLRTGN